MPLFCFVHRQGQAVPYFEVLAEMGDHALERAAELMAERDDAVRVELWEDDRLVHSLEREAV